MNSNIDADTIDAVVMMTDEEYKNTLQVLKAEDHCSYHKYISGGTRIVMSQLTRITGHGTYICDVDPNNCQDTWLRASARLREFVQYRSKEAWSYMGQDDDVAKYGYLRYTSRPDMACHIVEIVRHGVDCSNIETPWEAVAAVRKEYLVCA